MIKLKNYLLSTYRNVISSIAFYPILITSLFVVSSAIALALENNGMSKYLLETVPFLVINNADTARTILSTFIAGLLSLTVFSFSMVMLILSQASSNYSPRLLPELISNKRHQFVLGFYLGTIVYCILVLISILPDGDAYTLPGFAILLGIGFGLACLGMFVYFIHAISQEIQINFILKRIFERTKKRLETLKEEEKNQQTAEPNTEEWQEIYGNQNGYFQGVSIQTILELSKELGTIFQVLPVKGMFILKSIPIVKSKKQLNEEEQEEVLSCLQYSGSVIGEDNYVFGFKQITEIAVKAMSPGINDPGTAINAIDYLSELLASRMQLNDKELYLGENDKLALIQTTVNFDELLYNILASLRQYCKHDVIIIQKLLMMLKYLSHENSIADNYKNNIKNEVQILMDDAELFIKNKADQKVLKRLASSI